MEGPGIPTERVPPRSGDACARIRPWPARSTARSASSIPSISPSTARAAPGACTSRARCSSSSPSATCSWRSSGASSRCSLCSAMASPGSPTSRWSGTGPRPSGTRSIAWPATSGCSPTCSAAASPSESRRPVRLERPDLGLVVAQLLQDLAAVLPEHRGDSDHRLRGGELDGIAHGDVAPAHRMLDLDDHVPGAGVRIGHHLAGVEAGPAGHAGAGENLHALVLGALRGPRSHEAIDLVPALPAGLRRLVARIPDEILASDGAQERMPHLLLGEDEDVVIRPAGMAAVRRARHVRAELIARSRRRLAEALVIAEAHADEVHHHVLHGDLDLLALPGLVALHEPGEDPDHAVHARAGVSDGRPDIRGRAVGEARDAHASPHGLGYRLVALVVAVRSVGAEPLDARVHEARVERLHGGIAEAQAIEDAPPEVLEEHVGRLQEGPKDLLASGVLQVEGKAPLVGVEGEEEEAVGVRPVPMRVTRRIPPLRLLAFADVGPQPREHLAAGGPRLTVRDVDHSNAR